jgi:hypothetical protein
MSAQDVSSSAWLAGFRGDALTTAIAISLAEDPSSDPNAHCLNCAGVSEDSRGPWQINVNAHPQYASVDLYNPVLNAQAAYAISSGGTNFNPWSTFIYGTYKTYLAQAATLAASVSGSPPASTPAPPSSSLPSTYPPTLNPVKNPRVAVLAAFGLVAAVIVFS